MLKGSNRIKKDKEFGQIFYKGRNLNEEFLLFKILENNKKDSRFGFVISKKVSKNSTTRNRIKRILGEIVRKKIGEIKKGFDIVVIVKKDITKMSFTKIKKSVESALKRALD